MVLDVTDETLEEVLKSNDIVVLDFWAEWCGPCRVYGPIVSDFESETPGVVVGKVNVDLASSSAANFGVRGIPTTIFFKGGEVVAKESGVLSKEKLTSIIGNLG